MARESRTPFVILGILGILDGKPLSGYDIKHIIDGTISHFWAESYGQIYPVLKRLAADKLIRARALRQDGRRKVLYTITAKGEAYLATWLQRPPEDGPRRDELILKLFFGSKMEIPVLVRHLQARRDQAQAMADQYSGWLGMVGAQKQTYTPFQLMTLRGGIVMSKAFVEWADESLATLRRMEKGK
jgi:DNA-binding PadR family transcriptional regulator